MTFEKLSLMQRRYSAATCAAVIALLLTACNAAPQPAGDQRGAGGAVAPQPDPTATAVVNSGVSGVARGGSRSKPTVSGAATAEVLLPGETAVSPSTAVQSDGNGSVRFEVMSAVYDVSGKPVNGCESFDSKTPVRRLTLTLNLSNVSGADMAAGSWGAAAFAGGNRATLCLGGAQSALPAIAAGGKESLEFAAFVGPEESVTALTIGTADGVNSSICFEGEQAITCP